MIGHDLRDAGMKRQSGRRRFLKWTGLIVFVLLAAIWWASTRWTWAVTRRTALHGANPYGSTLGNGCLFIDV